MMAAPEVPPSLRRAANARARFRDPPRPGSKLYEAAAAGIITRSNTKPGTRGRQAVEAASYGVRRSARPTTSAREALGHRPVGSVLPWGRFFGVPVDGGGPRVVEGVVSAADVHRIGRYDNLVGRLAAGRINGKGFERRVRDWRPIEVLGPERTAGTYHFVSNPTTALALRVEVAEAVAAGEDSWIISGRSRPLPRRRSSRRRRR